MPMDIIIGYLTITIETWTTPPFQADVRNGRLFGRGSGDMKAGIVAYIQAYSTY